MKKIFSRLESWILPYCCIACNKPSDRQQDLCSACLKLLPFIQTACYQCAYPLPVHGLCGQCLKHAPSFDSAIAAFTYTNPIPSFIQQFKYQHRLVYGRVLSELLRQQLEHHPITIDALIPMPLHWWRHLCRGYNQSQLVAKLLSKHFHLPVYQQQIKRYRATKIQRSLTKSHREENMKNAFTIGKPFPYRRVAIIDDVMTTGNTVNALAKTLKLAGVTWVEVWVIARTPNDLP